MKTILSLTLAVLSLPALALTDADIIAATIWMEARGEGSACMDAVASVICNRSRKSGQKPAVECLRRNQFSCWTGKTTAVIPRNAKGKEWAYCRLLGRKVANKTFKPTMDATHFYNPLLVIPKWGRKMKTVKWVGDTRFCK